ncbi:MAG TPA: hypothetical protein VMW16_14970 [Sedimentisphaerales bacterium]|nr:hypothetical protein [Sedimentisphaerales bacterium]
MVTAQNREHNIKKTSYFAVASAVCALIALTSAGLFALLLFVGADCGLFVIVSAMFFKLAFWVGILSLVAMTIWHKRYKGFLYAVVAIICSLPPLYFIYGIESAAVKRYERKKEWTGLYNLELLGKELRKYAEAHGGCLPVADQWCDSLIENNPELTKDNFRHPQPEILAGMFEFKGACQFAFNRNLSGLRLGDVRYDVVLIFEADGEWNLNGTGELLKTRYREKGCIAILFADQTIADYWYYMKAVRKFDKSGKIMYYVQPRWEP